MCPVYTIPVDGECAEPVCKEPIEMILQNGTCVNRDEELKRRVEESYRERDKKMEEWLKQQEKEVAKINDEQERREEERLRINEEKRQIKE